MRRPWIYISTAIATAIVTLWLLQDPLIGALTKWQIERLSEHTFGQPLSYDQCERTGRTLLFHCPRFASQAESSGSVDLSADLLEVSVEVDLVRFHFHVDLLVTAPRVRVVKSGARPPAIAWQLPKGRRIVSPTIRWEVRDGSLELTDMANGEYTLFPLIARGMEGPKRESKVWCSTDLLCAHFSEATEERRLVLDMAKSDLAALFGLAHFFNPQLLGGWEMVEGTVDGTLSFCQPYQAEVSCQGGVELINWSFHHPSSALWGSFDRAALSFHKGETPIVGTLCLDSGGKLSSNHPALPPWELDLARGSVELRKETLSGTLTGSLAFADSTCSLNAEGEVRLSPAFEMGLELAWLSPNSRESIAHSHLCWSTQQPGHSHLDLELVRNGRQQAAMIQALAGDWLPEALQFEILTGTVSARIGMEWLGGEPREIAVDEIFVDDLTFLSSQSGRSGGIVHACGKFNTTLSQRDFLKDLGGELKISGASMQFDAEERIEELEGSIRATEGRIDQIDLSARYRDMTATCRFDPLATRFQLLFTLDALGLDLHPWLPEKYQSSFIDQFSCDTFTIEAALTPTLDTLHLEGNCLVRSLGSSSCERLEIGADFDLRYARSWTPINSWSELLLGFLDQRVDSKAVWERGRCVGLQLREGRVHGVDLPLHRYAPVLALLDPDYRVAGVAEMVGQFDQKKLTIAYEARDVTFETSLFRVEVNRIGNLSSLMAFPEESPMHQVDFSTGKQRGLIPVAGALCWIRAGDLWFDGVEGLVELTGPDVRVTEIAADAEGVHFEGHLDLDRSHPGCSRLLLSAPTAFGAASAAQTVCAHYSRMALWDLPLQGWVETRDEGLQLLFHFYPDHSDLELTASGWLRHGSWTNPSGRLALSDLDLSFDYDHIPRLLRLGAADGDLIQQLDGESLHYSLVTHEAVISDLDRGYGSFDLELYQDELRVARLAGSALPVDPDYPEGKMEISLDPSITYLGNLQPKLHECVMKSWTHPLSVSGNLSCDLETIGRDAALLHLLSIPFPTPYQIRTVAGDANKGVLGGHFLLKEEEGWRLRLAGEGLTIRDRPIGRFETVGGWREGRWQIEQLTADTLSLSADIVEEEEGWTIQRLSVQSGSDGAVELSGFLKRESLELNATLHHLFCRLPYFAPSLEIDGELSGRGECSLRLAGDWTRWVQSVAFELDPANLLWRGVPVALTEPTQGGWSRGNEVVVGPGGGRVGEEVPFAWSKALFSLQKERGAIHGLRFSTSLSRAEALVMALGGDRSWLSYVLPADSLSGTANLTWDVGAPLRLEMDLADGEYEVGGQWWSLSEFQLILDHRALSLTACTPLFDLPYWVTLTTTPFAPKWGRLCLSQWRELDLPHLAIDWRYEEGLGVQLERAIGSLQGLHFNLIGCSSEERGGLLLRGQIGVDGRSPLLPPPLRTALAKLSVGDGYWLDGLFLFSQELSPSFHGYLTGTDAEIGGIQVQTLSAQLACSSKSVSIGNLKIQDPAGEVAVERVALERDESGEWTFSLPSAVISNAKLERLRMQGGLPKRLRSMEIPRAELRHFGGPLARPEEWTGRGFLQFDTPDSSRQGNGILSIPAELIGRLGLEGGSLTPAIGTIRYRISDGKVVLTDFKEVYSRNRYSQFLLANRKEKAYIDFDGRLNIPLRMKQNNLLMKFTEMFLISVQGSLTKPQVSLKDPNPSRRQPCR